jgi:hypothetical protein
MFKTVGVDSPYFFKHASFLLKIEQDPNIDDQKELTFVIFIFITHLNTFGSNMLLTLKNIRRFAFNKRYLFSFDK